MIRVIVNFSTIKIRVLCEIKANFGLKIKVYLLFNAGHVEQNCIQFADVVLTCELK